jgi:hypothetical protein
MPDAEKPFLRNAERLFQRLLNALLMRFVDADAADLTGLRRHACASISRKAPNQWQRFTQW